MDIKTLYSYFLKSSGVCTDTRKITENCIFFALTGSNFNGNTFAQKALDQGALLAVIDEKAYETPDGKTALVLDSLKTLQDLATYHRKKLGIPIIALTGSNGKTTTKELINSVLSKKFNTVATKGNLNNHIGVPLTLLSMKEDTEMGIVEMGANHLKEIEALCTIAQPDYGYITNFGKAHIEGFGSLEGVVRGKTELYHYLRIHDKTVFINNSDTRQVSLSEGINTFSFGDEKAECTVILETAKNKVVLRYNKITIQSNLIGAYNFDNLAAAIAIGSYFEVADQKIKEAIEGYIPENNRSQTLEKNGHQIILDAYNANPTSMLAALKNFKQRSGENKVVFLGDMFELGDSTKEEHEAIVTYLVNHHFCKVYLLGENFSATKLSAPHIEKFENFDSFQKFFRKETLPPGHLLIKASRGMALERILGLL